MLKRGCVWGTVLTIGSLLVGGCRTNPPRSDASTRKPADPSPAHSSRSDWPEAKLAQAHAHYAAAVINELNDEHKEALVDFYQAALNDPENESLILDVSRRFLQNKEPQKAFEIVSPAADRPNASGAIFARLGLIYTQLGKNDEAVLANRAAVKRAPQSLAGYQNLVLNYLQAKQEPEALKVMDEAARQPSTEPEFLLGVSDFYLEYGLRVPVQKEKVKAKALALLNRALKANPSSPGVLLKLADNLDAVGDSKQAAQLYLEALKKLPDVPPLRERIHAKLAEFYVRAGDSPHAKEHLEAVVHEDPTNPQAYYWLGSFALDEKKPAEAVEYFRKTILLAPDAPESRQAYYDLAMAQIEIKQPEAALATLETARKKFSQNYPLEMLTGMAYSAQKKYPQAIEHFIAAEVVAQATDPKRLNFSFYFQLGAAYERKGDYDQAEKYFQKCLQLAPDYPEALNYLGFMWAEHGMKLDRARALIEKAVKAEPKNAAYLDSLGWVLFKLNQPKAALDYVLKAAELSEEPDPTLFDHLGDIYLALQKPEQARDAWRKSLGLEPNEAVRKKLDAAK